MEDVIGEAPVGGLLGELTPTARSMQKLLFPELFGAGRFAQIGIPFPDLAGPVVGWVELACGYSSC